MEVLLLLQPVCLQQDANQRSTVSVSTHSPRSCQQFGIDILLDLLVDEALATK